MSASRETDAVSADFVGRRVELARLRRAIEDAVRSDGSVMLLTGEPGVGKSRLADEAATQAEAAGMVVLRGAGWEGVGAPPYHPWNQAIRALAAHRGAGEMLEAELHDLARLVPELGAQSSPEPEPAGEQRRFRLFDAVASFLRRVAASRPLLLVFDDLHCADVGTVMLLRFCGRELRRTRVLLLGVFRDLEVDAASELGRQLAGLREQAATLSLVGLEPAAVQDLLAAAIGHHEARRLAPDVQRRSGGNPLFVRELGRLLTSPDRPGLGTASSIPESIRSILDRRFSKLSTDTLELLVVAAACGEQVRLDLLELVSGHAQELVLECLDGALRARLVQQTDHAAPRFAFAHTLIREALYERLSLAERAEIHRRIAAALERTEAADPPFAELANHFLKAALPTGDMRAVDYAEKAGRQSFDRLAFEDAAAHFQRALEALDRSELHDHHRARLHLALGEARIWSGEMAEAREAHEAAAALARRSRRPDILAAAALGLSAGLGGFEIRLFDRAQVDLLEEALEQLEETESALRARVLALLSIALTFADSPERRRRLAKQAVAAARRVGDPSALAQALGAHCDAMSGPDHSKLRLAQATEMVSLARRARDPCMELLGRRHRLVALLELGDIAAVDAEIEAYDAAAQPLRQPLYLWYVPMWRAMRALMDGRVDECRALTEDVQRIGRRARSQNAALLAEVLRWNRLREQGQMRETAEVLREQLKLAPGVPGEPFWVALVVPTERPGEAKAVLRRLAADDFAELPKDAIWLACMSGLAEACVVVRDRAAAEAAYRMLSPYGGRFAIDGTAAACYGSMSRYLGMLAAVLGRFDRASEHFQEALDANRRAGSALLVAHTLRAYGSMLLEAGDPQGAEETLGEALAAYRELGLDVWVDQVGAMLGAVPGGNVFRREGDTWTLAYERRSVRLKDAKGLRDIATLIASPGREFHVADLIAASEAGPRPPPDDDLRPSFGGHLILDARARSAYRARLDELREELEEAELFGDTGRATKTREEMDFIAGELASALGLGGRPRRTGDPMERARKAVAQRVRNALRRIETEHPALGRHLDHSLRLGRFCSYLPERPIDWSL